MANGLRKLIKKAKNDFKNPSLLRRIMVKCGLMRAEELEERIAP